MDVGYLIFNLNIHLMQLELHKGDEMTTYIYPQPEWVDDSVALYDEKFEKKLKKLMVNEE